MTASIDPAHLSPSDRLLSKTDCHHQISVLPTVLKRVQAETVVQLVAALVENISVETVLVETALVKSVHVKPVFPCPRRVPFAEPPPDATQDPPPQLSFPVTPAPSSYPQV